MRELMRNKPVVMIFVVIAVFACIGFIATRGSDDVSIKMNSRYYYDLDTASLIAVASDAQPPTGAVVARVYTCGQCTDAEMRIAYLEQRTDATREAAENIDFSSGEALHALNLAPPIAAVPQPGESPKWLERGTREAAPIEARRAMMCNGAPPKTCTP